jgi:hypothetical protein
MTNSTGLFLWEMLMNRLIVLEAICIASIVGCSSATDPTIHGHDSFGPNALASYDHYSDNGNPWQVSPDTLKANGVGLQSVLIRKGDGFLDGWVEIETSRVDDGGLVLRFLDNEHYYVLAIRDDSAPVPRPQENLEIYERSGPGADGFHILWFKDIPWPRGTAHRIRFDAVADVLSVFVDDALVGSVNRTAPFVGERFGIRHYGSSADWNDRFRNFRWQSLPLPD